jgi:hypothetical protein
VHVYASLDFRNLLLLNVQLFCHRRSSGRYTIRPGYEATIKDPAEAARTAIPVENISAPIFLVSGSEDRIWPSQVFASKIVQRASANPDVTHLQFPEAGHLIDLPNQPRKPSPTAFFDHGGNPEADEHASRESWAKLLKWLGRLPVAHLEQRRASHPM